MVRLLRTTILLCIAASRVCGEESKVPLGGGVELTLVRIEAGTFRQGSAPTEAGRNDDERAREVTLTRGFHLGKFPVTRGQFQRFVAESGFRTEAEKGTSGGFGVENGKLVQRKEFTWKNPGFPQTENDPVVIVSWNDAKAFLAWLSRKAGAQFDLPTEAQWEYACRAGTADLPYPGGANADAVAWHKANAEFRTHPVGQKALNAWGLGDMMGNVWEWCTDWYGPWGSEAARDPLQTNPNLSDKPRRVLRGGSFLKDPMGVRAAARYRNDLQSRNADNGFRVMVYSLAAPQPLERPSPPQPPALELEKQGAASTTTPRDLPSTVSHPAHEATDPTISNVSDGVGGLLGFAALAGGAVLVLRFLFKSRTPSRTLFTRSPDSSPNLGGGPRVRTAEDGFWITDNRVPAGTELRCRYHDGGQYRQIDVTARGGEQFVYTGQRPNNVTIVVLNSQTSQAAPLVAGIGMFNTDERERERERREREEEERRRRNRAPSAY